MKHYLLSAPFLTVLGSTALLGLVAAVLGAFSLLQKRALLGESLAHATLPGIGLAYIFASFERDPGLLFVGAALAAGLGALLVHAIIRSSHLSADAAQALVLSIFFGSGVVILSYIQRQPQGGKSGLESFVFGQAATLVPADAILIAIVSFLTLATIIIFFRYFELVCFDRELAICMGVPTRAVEITLVLLLIVVISVGLQAVGAVLFVAALVIPGASAHQMGLGLRAAVVAAAMIGFLSSAGGVLLSSAAERLPTGATIVVIQSVIFVLAFCGAPRRVAGLLREVVRLVRGNRA